jgi:hypothetical protein
VLTTEGHRCALQRLHGKRLRVTGHVAGFGGTRNARVRTWVVTDVRDAETDELLADHAWVPVVGDDWAADFHVGDVISFDAVVETYIKSDSSARIARLDFGLADVAEVELVKAA